MSRSSQDTGSGRTCSRVLPGTRPGYGRGRRQAELREAPSGQRFSANRASRTLEIVTPNEIARKLGITGLQFRNWLRDKKAVGHPLLVGHVKHQRYEFSRSEADDLAAEYRSERGILGATSAPARAYRPAKSKHVPVDISTEPGHRIEIEWTGRTVTTLEDLLRSGLMAVVVGINPAPPSVAAGHYWQGRTGHTLWRRLRAVGLLPDEFDGYEDDAAFAAGVGFTDVVKRPTAGASELSRAELEHGLSDLEAKLADAGAPLVIFAFKQAATTLLGDFQGNGFVPSLRLGASEVFVMPGPYQKAETADATLEGLRQRVTNLRGA